MSQYILIRRIKVQNANAIAGFTWGFPAITHFLGFSHNLSRKLSSSEFRDICIKGCVVICHEHEVHDYHSFYYSAFTQNRTPPYLKSHNKTKPPPVIEEGKMNMTVSLIMEFEGNIGNRKDNFEDWLKKTCLMQHLAGGSILEIKSIKLFDDAEESIRRIKRSLLPGFMLMDRSEWLESHFQKMAQKSSDAELLDAWLDFASKQKARPRSDLITKHFNSLVEMEPENERYNRLLTLWGCHLEHPYEASEVPEEIRDYFDQFATKNKELLNQWQKYCSPTEKSGAEWEYFRKPGPGYLVPIMAGYKAISEIKSNQEVSNTRDNETDICFVESVHSVGEWLSVHRLKRAQDLKDCLWYYHHEDNWYLCKQKRIKSSVDDRGSDLVNENPDDDFS